MSAKRYDPLLRYGEVEMIELLHGEYVTYESYKSERARYEAMLVLNEVLTTNIKEGKL